jgi:hypothetical protein
MARQKRYPLLLDTDYPPEKRVLGAIHSVPDGERAGVLRVLILLGHEQIERESGQRQESGSTTDGAETP